MFWKVFAPSLRYGDFSKGMWFGSQQLFVGKSIAWRQKEQLWSRLCLWQIGDNVTCPWENCGDAKYTFQDPFNHQRSSNTISSPDLYPVISHYLSLVACGVWWEGGKWGRQMTVFLSSPFPSSPAPEVRYVRRLLGTSQYHHSYLLWDALLLGTIFTSLFASWLILNHETSR